MLPLEEPRVVSGCNLFGGGKILKGKGEYSLGLVIGLQKIV